jgi:cation transport ATPase
MFALSLLRGRTTNTATKCLTLNRTFNGAFSRTLLPLINTPKLNTLYNTQYKSFSRNRTSKNPMSRNPQVYHKVVVVKSAEPIADKVAEEKTQDQITKEGEKTQDQITKEGEKTQDQITKEGEKTQDQITKEQKAREKRNGEKADKILGLIWGIPILTMALCAVALVMSMMLDLMLGVRIQPWYIFIGLLGICAIVVGV